MNMTVPHRPLKVRIHLREAEIACLPSLISMNTVKKYDQAAHFDSMRVPTLDSPPIATRQPGRPRIKPIPVPAVRKSALILADDYQNIPATELAQKHGVHVSYVRRVIRNATGEPLKVKTPARDREWYIAIAVEYKDGASRPALKGKYGLDDKQLSYALIKGKKMANEDSLIGGLL